MSGLVSYLAGRSAEEQVLRRYVAAGHRVLARRWAGRAGEIDLILEKDDEIVFVEVKASATFARAAARLSRRQADRLLRSAEDCLGSLPRQSLTAMRFDLAMVDGLGRIEILPNALAA